MSRYFFTNRRNLKVEVIKALKLLLVKKFLTGAINKGCGDFGASRTIFLTVLKLLMVQIDNFRTSKLFPPLGDSQGSFARRSVNGTVGARVVARCALRSPSS